MDAFKLPQNIPQDLLLIHDLIGVTAPPVRMIRPEKIADSDDCIDSSDSDNASEDEIAADLTALNDEDELLKTIAQPDSSSDSSSCSDSDSDAGVSGPDDEKSSGALDLEDEEESGPVPSSGTYFQTKNEVLEADVAIPDILEVGPEEVLEKVGEIMTIMGNTVIIMGIPSELANRGSERALDSDTLLVFKDRKVLGYVFETFGPTSQPLYQVKFNKEHPLDVEKVQISREVFHVPARSNFVFLSHLKELKGSDASNVHDEEPADNELEFSDDEAEAAYKSSLKRKRGESRAHSIAASSRQSTPLPSLMHDQDMIETGNFSRNPYDEHGLYDVEFGAGPSRPAPIPYDDPYSDTYSVTGASQTKFLRRLEDVTEMVGEEGVVGVEEGGAIMAALLVDLLGMIYLRELAGRATWMIIPGLVDQIYKIPGRFMVTKLLDRCLRHPLLSPVLQGNFLTDPISLDRTGPSSHRNSHLQWMCGDIQVLFNRHRCFSSVVDILRDSFNLTSIHASQMRLP
ncbi:hypothetical protein H0H81_003733 [Sphagnurus paluster]|uniref:H/ACA ribonucleoprotein complex non-core subunit NAF1 n=1 Tax=Sphagnurus paluster TaxID=117069 RepID=A0A9P7FV07_9AGAR|nr:hypothetical protein H0H81_003733 [Sphagnurus paluster]